MGYDDQGKQAGRELLEDTDPAPYVAWKRTALAHAQPLGQYRAGPQAGTPGVDLPVAGSKLTRKILYG
jgi:hypothetical protein